MSKQFNTIFAFTVVLLFFFGLFLLHSLTAYAQPTPTINYQGKLTDNTGVAVADGTYNMRFWLLQSTGQATTSAVWTESLTGANQVQVTNGLFSVMLGSTSALTSVDFNQPLYLGVEIGGTGAPSWDGEMLPRKPLGTVPAAFESFQLGGVASSSFLRSDAADTMAATEASTLLTINQSGTGDILNLLDGGAEVFTILDGGNVGIGSSSPSSKLTVAGNVYAGGALRATGTVQFDALTNGLLQASSDGTLSAVATSSLGLGTVTSVAASVPTGWTITGSPITNTGTLAFAYDTGYAAVRTASTTNWNTFYDTPSSRITAGSNLSWSSNTLNATYAGQAGGWSVFDGTNVPIASSVTETTVFTQDIPANTLNGDGQEINFTSVGTYLNNTGGNTNFTLRFKVGGTTVYADATGNVATNATGRPVTVTGKIIRMSPTQAKIIADVKVLNAGAATTGSGDFGATSLRTIGSISTDASWTWSATTTFSSTIQLSSSAATHTYTHDFISMNVNGEVDSTSLFTDGGATTYLTSLSDALAVGTTSSSSAKFIVESDSANTGDYVFRVYSSSGPLFDIDDFGVARTQQNVRIYNSNFATERARISNSGYFLAADGLVSTPAFTFLDDSNTGIFSPSNGVMAFANDSSETMRLTGTGNVGIGTSSPNAKLTVAGEINIDDPTAGISFLGARYFTASNTIDSVFVGEDAGQNVIADTVSAFGWRAGRQASTTASAFSTYIGSEAGYGNTGAAATFLGAGAGYQNIGATSTIIGFGAGTANSADLVTIVGPTAGVFNSGFASILVGADAGRVNTGTSTIAIGNVAAEFNDGEYGIFIGEGAGYLNTGNYNSFIGPFSGAANDGDNNVLVGYSAGVWMNGSGTVALGSYALNGPGSIFAANNNTALGYRAGASVDDGASNNILLGYRAADSLTTGANNIIIGYDVEAPSNTGSNQLNIGNLIFGTGINGAGTTLSTGNIGIGTTSPFTKLTVDGGFMATGALYDNSYSAGTNGMVLQSTGSGFNWVATSSLGFASSSNLMFTGSSTFAVERTVQSKLRDIVSFLDYGAAGDGTTDDRAALVAADADDVGVLFLPKTDGNYRLSTTYNPTTPIVSLGGQFVPDSGNFFARSLLDLGSNPYIYGQRNFAAGDYTDTPVEDYTIMATSSQLYLYWINQDGYQEPDTDGNLSGAFTPGKIPGGQSRMARTGAQQVYLRGSHSGMGDAYNLYTTMSATQHASTSDVTWWSGQNATGFLSAQNLALTDKVTLYGLGDLVLNDNGNDDVAMFGQTLFLDHDGGNTGDYGIPRLGQLIISRGASSADAGSAIRGNFDIGIDLSGGTFATSTALALAANQRISWDATPVSPSSDGKFTTRNVGDTYTYFTGTGLIDVVGSTTILQRYNDNVLITSGTADLETLRVGGASSTKYTAIGQSGTVSYLSAVSTASDNTQISFRTANAGTEGDRMFISANGNVGIGDTSPSTRLDVQGTNGSAGIRLQASSGSGSSQLFIDADGDGAFTALDSGGTTDLYLTSNGASYFNGGNLGVGTTSPGRTLTVDGDARITGILYDNANSAGVDGMVLQSTGTGFQWVATSSLGITGGGSSLFTDAGNYTYLTSVTDEFTIGSSTANNAKLSIQTEGAIDILNLFNTAGQEVFTVLENGNVGIGDATPTTRLDVQGTNGSAGVRLQASTGSGASQLFIDADGDGAFTALDSGGTTDLYLTSNGASYFNGGNLGIGTSSPASKLDVWGDFRVGTSSTPNFFVRTDNGRIGIGTDTPGRLLDIVSKAPVIAMTDTDTNAVVRLSSDTANGSFQFEIDDTGAVAGSDMNIQIDGITYFTFEEGGRLGIGDTTPDQMLEISTSSNPQILLKEGAVDFLRLGVGETASTSIIGYSAVNDLLFGVYSSGSDTTLNSEYARFSSIGDFMVDGTTNATLYVDASSNRVGIGSSTPTYDLSVAGLLYGDSLLTEGANGVTNYIGRADGISGGTPTNLNNQDLLITGGNNNNFAIASQGNTGNEGLLFGNYNGTTFTEYMRLDAVSGGYLGLGTTSPRALLTVGSSTSVALQAGELYNSAYIAGSLEIDGILYDSVNNSAGTSGMVLQTTGSGFQWVATSSLGISGGITGTEGYAITFDSAGDQVATSSLFFASNGEIGIGTTTPTEKLTIYDPAAVKIDLTSLNGKPGLFFTRLNNRTVPSVGTVLGEIEAFSWAGSVTKGASIEFVTDAAWGGGDAPTAILFQTAPDGSNVVSERMRITNAGDVGIGTTSPASKLDVWGDFRVGTSGTPTLFTDVSAELIGIQTATPVADVHIGSDNTSPQMYIAGPGSGSNPLTTARPTTDDSQLILGRYTNASGGGIEFITSPAANGWGWKLNAPDQGGRQDFRIQNRNNSAAWSEVFTIKSSTGNVGIGTTSPIAKLAIDNSAASLSGAGVAGLDQYLLTENSVASAVQFGNRSWLRASNTATTTIVGNIIRVEDVTTFGNTVRGLEVQTNRGANTNGENTALSGFGRTFGVRGVTNANAGGTFEPAGGFFETEGTTQGNAIRGYSSSITTASLLSLFQDTSNFQGTGLQMNFGNTTGDFSSTSSKYLDFQNAGTSVFTVSAFGTTTIGDGTTNNMAGLQIGYGGICVDNDGSCTASTTGRITSVESQTGNSDLAEMYFSSQDLEPGEVVTLYDELSIRRATADSDMPVLGVVSTKPGLTLGFDDESTRAGERGYPLALAGRVPIKLSTENGPIKAGDSLMLSSLPGIAMKADGTGTIVGIALEDFNDTRMYSDTYINQFGDDIAEPDFTPITVNDDPRINDGCYYGGGGAAGEAPCIPLQTETVDQQIAEANELAEAEAIEDALRDLRYVSSETRALADGTVVSVGQIVMFVDRAQQLLAPDQLALFDVLMGTSSLSNQADKDEPESVFDRMVALADRFVAGVLSVFELRAERVETSELCVDGVCITADDLRALLEADKAPTPVSDPTPAPTPVADDSNDGDVVDTSDVNETSQDTSTSTEETASSTTSTSSEPVAESPEPVPPTQATQETTEPTDDATTPEVEVTEPVVNEIVIAEPAEQETSSEGEETVENTSDNGTGGQ